MILLCRWSLHESSYKSSPLRAPSERRAKVQRLWALHPNLDGLPGGRPIIPAVRTQPLWDQRSPNCWGRAYDWTRIELGFARLCHLPISTTHSPTRFSLTGTQATPAEQTLICSRVSAHKASQLWPLDEATFPQGPYRAERARRICAQEQRNVVAIQNGEHICSKCMVV